jgi:23S rRNA (adenine2030-N6)-methyltransferase
MPYTHFGKQADVWKHLSLCEVMIQEQPSIYIETNSACSDYSLSNTPEQQYGIYHFVETASDYKDLFKSSYFELECSVMKQNKYLGSPGLAMRILGTITDKLFFFDIEPESLNTIAEFAAQNHIADKIETINRDSVIGVMDMLPALPKSTLIHIDPYYIDQPNENGYDYLDLFAKATELGMKCFLWYGFNTLNEKKSINKFITEKLKNSASANLSCMELILETIQKDTIPCNPGILGSGLLTSNLSTKSISTILNYSNLLIDLYKGTTFKGFKGDLYRDIIDL